MTKQPIPNKPPTRAIVVSADVSRWGEAMSTSAEHVWTKVSQKDMKRTGIVGDRIG